MPVAKPKNTDELINTLLPPRNIDEAGEYEQIYNVDSLPQVGVHDFINFTVTTILGWAILFVILGIVVAGFIYLTSQGKEDTISTSKNIIIYLLVGLAVMISAYAVILGISQFDFFASAP